MARRRQFKVPQCWGVFLLGPRCRIWRITSAWPTLALARKAYVAQQNGPLPPGEHSHLLTKMKAEFNAR